MTETIQRPAAPDDAGNVASNPSDQAEELRARAATLRDSVLTAVDGLRSDGKLVKPVVPPATGSEAFKTGQEWTPVQDGFIRMSVERPAPDNPGLASKVQVEMTPLVKTANGAVMPGTARSRVFVETDEAGQVHVSGNGILKGGPYAFNVDSPNPNGMNSDFEVGRGAFDVAEQGFISFAHTPAAPSSAIEQAPPAPPQPGMLPPAPPQY